MQKNEGWWWGNLKMFGRAPIAFSIQFLCASFAFELVPNTMCNLSARKMERNMKVTLERSFANATSPAVLGMKNCYLLLFTLLNRLGEIFFCVCNMSGEEEEDDELCKSLTRPEEWADYVYCNWCRFSSSRYHTAAQTFPKLSTERKTATAFVLLRPCCCFNDNFRLSSTFPPSLSFVSHSLHSHSQD